MTQTQNDKSADIILGIESSCDETAAALVRCDGTILAHQIASQAETHAAHGGVVPEVAARGHLDTIQPVITACLKEAGLSLDDVSGIAATGGPGLIGGVLIGTLVAKSIAAARAIPYYAINHLEGHALTARLTDEVAFPYLLLLISGGHTQLLVVEGLGQYKRLGTSLDDAAGEAFDKGAKLLGLGYPGGPAIEKAARTGDPKKVDLPRPRARHADCHFSFSGLKTALAQKIEKLGSEIETADFAASLQQAIAGALATRTQRAMQQFKSDYPEAREQLVIAGGVAANQEIARQLRQLGQEEGFELIVPPAKLCTDNGAMIAWAGAEYHLAGQPSGLDFAPRPRWPLDPNAQKPPGRGVRA